MVIGDKLRRRRPWWRQRYFVATAAVFHRRNKIRAVGGVGQGYQHLSECPLCTGRFQRWRDREEGMRPADR